MTGWKAGPTFTEEATESWLAGYSGVGEFLLLLGR